MTIRIAMWSGPRNISTAMMRSWEARSDCTVSDEPLYAHWLTETETDHPGRAEIIESQPTDWRDVTRSLAGKIPGGARVWYQKHMALHLLPHIDRQWMKTLRHCFLLRNPEEVIASYLQKRPTVTIEDIGIHQQREIYDYVNREIEPNPPIVDSTDVLQDPRGVLTKLCSALGVDFQESMLQWSPGRRDTDGVWAKHWYQAVEQSTGFAPYKSRTPMYPKQFAAVAAKAQESYAYLHAKRL